MERGTGVMWEWLEAIRSDGSDQNDMRVELPHVFGVSMMSSCAHEMDLFCQRNGFVVGASGGTWEPADEPMRATCENTLSHVPVVECLSQLTAVHIKCSAELNIERERARRGRLHDRINSMGAV